jgi:hypothetical protein
VVMTCHVHLFVLSVPFVGMPIIHFFSFLIASFNRRTLHMFLFLGSGT